MFQFFSRALLQSYEDLIRSTVRSLWMGVRDLVSHGTAGDDELVWTRRRSGEAYPNSKRARQRRHRQARRRTVLRRRRANRRAS